MAKSIDSEIRAAVECVSKAKDALSKNPSRENQEAVCVETRAAYATFEDVTCWTGKVDENTRARMIKVFQAAVDLLQQSQAEQRYVAAVQRRLEGLKEFNLKKVAPHLALPD